MTRKKIFFTILFFLLFVSSSSLVLAEDFNCPDRYLTLINPVRGRNLWLNPTLKPLEDQYQLIASHHFSATWLLQYDALTDQDLVDFIKDNFKDQELGLFLEVSPDFAQSSRVIYPDQVAWFDPQAVFLSGYSPSERRKLIDTLFNQFKQTFGHYPSSVGAWWIDSYSLNYMKKNYNIRSTLIVADQKTTDDYGVWGQWWGIPYYPSKANILTPAQDEQDKQDLIILQWAQRDLTRSYGEGPAYSNYSLQANDYTERGLDTSYFENLVKTYLDCSLPLGQITVGLETGIESVRSFAEYQNQLQSLTTFPGLKSLTMTDFARHYQTIYPKNPEKISLKDSKGEWFLSPQKRENISLKDSIAYQSDLAFTDYFLADKSDFLDRKLPLSVSPKKSFNFLSLAPLVFVLSFWAYRRHRLIKYYWSVLLFVLVCFITILLSYQKFGRQVYFGPLVQNLPLIQFTLPLSALLFIIPLLKFFKKKKFNLKLFTLILPLTFSADFLISRLRYIRLADQYYFGFALDALRFFGLKITSPSFSFVNQDFSSVIAASFLRFRFNWIWSNHLFAFFVYPLAHIVLAAFIYLFCQKLPKKLRQVFLFIMTLLFCLYLYQVLALDPRAIS
jgi:hypothetical protein